MFAYEPTLNMLELKKDKDTKYVTAQKSKRAYNSKLRTSHIAFLHNIKLSGYRIEIQFSESVLVEEQINCTTKILNAYIVYNLND